jgi:hypothetical protein
MARLGPDVYGELLGVLATFYELVLLDLGTGVAGRLVQRARPSGVTSPLS